MYDFSKFFYLKNNKILYNNYLKTKINEKKREKKKIIYYKII